MIRRLAALAMLLTIPAALYAEVLSTSISATGTSSTTTLSRVAKSVTVCNCSTSICSAGASANAAYIRIFTDADTAAAATASHIELAIGACVSVDHFSGAQETGNGFYKIAALAASSGTATLKVTYE